MDPMKKLINMLMLVVACLGLGSILMPDSQAAMDHSPPLASAIHQTDVTTAAFAVCPICGDSLCPVCGGCPSCGECKCFNDIQTATPANATNLCKCREGGVCTCGPHCQCRKRVQRE